MILLRHDPFAAPNSSWSFPDTHFVRIICVAAAKKSIASGPPIRTGAPIGTARHTLVGKLIGKLQLITAEPVRLSLDPSKCTVFEPVTSVPSLPVGASLG